MARQPALVRAIKTEMASQEFRVRVELIEIGEFAERYPDVKSKTPKYTKENGKPKDGKGGKDKKDGQGGKEGKDGRHKQGGKEEGKEVEAEKRKYKWVSGEPE